MGNGEKGTREPQESNELPGKGEKWTKQAGHSFLDFVTDKLELVPGEFYCRAVMDTFGFKCIIKFI